MKCPAIAEVLRLDAGDADGYKLVDGGMRLVPGS